LPSYSSASAWPCWQAQARSPLGSTFFWNDCGLGPTATTARTFACNTNTGSHILVGSFDPVAGLTEVVGVSAMLDLASDTCPLPDWWQFKNPGTCRQSAMSANFILMNGQESCVSPWQAHLVGGVTTYMTGFLGDYRRVRMAVTGTMSTEFAVPVTSGTEYYAFNLVIDNAKTVGSGACTGCSAQVCIVLDEIKLIQPAGTPGGSPVLTSPISSYFVGWQFANSSICYHALDPGPLTCATPVYNRTWGQIKSLYR
jgi:hypothetical protein